MMQMNLKRRFLAWLCPDLIAEINQRRWFTEAIHDLHMVPIPYSEYTLEMGFQNCKAMEPAIITQKATIQDRQASLIEIFRRSQK